MSTRPGTYQLMSDLIRTNRPRAGLIVQIFFDSKIRAWGSEKTAIFPMRIWMKNPVPLVLLLLVTAACGHAPKYEVPVEFEPYVEEFRAQSLEHGVLVNTADLVMRRSGLPKGLIALCDSEGGTPRVTIRTGELVDLPAYNVALEEIVFHELGHCLLNLGHEDGAIHVMNSKLTNFSYYQDHRDEQLNELFDSRKLLLFNLHE